MIRMATAADVPAILEIYRPYILETTITFEYEVPSLEAFMERFEGISSGYPWLVWEEDGIILGYAYGDIAFVRAAYAWDADLSIYLHKDARGRGIGRRLYGCLEELLARLGYHNLYGIVTGENQASCRFHESCGYELQGTMRKSGYKLGRWLDVYWYCKRLHEACNPGAVPKPFVYDKDAQMILEKYSK